MSIVFTKTPFRTFRTREPSDHSVSDPSDQWTVTYL